MAQFARFLPLVCGFLVPLLAPEAAEGRGAAESALGVGPHQGAGTRKAPARPPAPSTAKEQPEVPQASHRVGPPPSRPRAVLPEGVAPAAADERARQEISGRTERRSGVDDAELSTLRAAERVLFPKPVRGVSSGWIWDEPASGGGASGLPSLTDLNSSADVSGLAAATQPSGQDAEWFETLNMPNIPVRLDQRVIKYLKFYRDDRRGRNVLKVWARKVGRYTPALQAEFARAGLPTDLVWMSLIESGHNPTIVSPAGAAGLWQFIPDTARLYGLTVDRWVDERFDPRRATQAAIRYLSDLHDGFGNWEMAMAAYNMGHGGLKRSVLKYNCNDFWRLIRYEAGIPWETTLYVPKILAIAIVMNNKRAFGIHNIQPDDPVRFDVLKLNSAVSLQRVASAAGVALEDIEQLNAHYLSKRTPPSSRGSKNKLWSVYVPDGKGVGAMNSLAKSLRGRADTRPVAVRFGDTLRTLADRYRTSEGRLRALNDIQPQERLEAGEVVLVPELADDKNPLPDREDWVVVSARRLSYPGLRRVFYKVLRGDTLEQVARAFRVSQSDIMVWNALDDSASLQADMTLQLYVPKKQDLSSVRYLTAKHTQVFEAGTPEFFQHFEAQNGRKRVVVLARKGDTLRSIGKRYGMSTSMMERINRFSRRKELSAGDRVVVYTKRAVPKRDRAEPRRVSLPRLDSGQREARAASQRGPTN